jgi:hypothetical protein
VKVALSLTGVVLVEVNSNPTVQLAPLARIAGQL